MNPEYLNQYISKPKKIKAIMYQREHNINEVLEAFGNCINYNPITNEYEITNPDNEIVQLNKGDFIVQDESSFIFSLPQEIFIQNFEYDKSTEPVPCNPMPEFDTDLTCMRCGEVFEEKNDLSDGICRNCFIELQNEISH